MKTPIYNKEIDFKEVVLFENDFDSRNTFELFMSEALNIDDHEILKNTKEITLTITRVELNKQSL